MNLKVDFAAGGIAIDRSRVLINLILIGVVMVIGVSQKDT